ncbi:hypothetical protein HYH02_010122 [Chlamydomonas schloesseri]|uniref:Uncharacterized protein n=1 Tax=Chlamydomonas schloesseri TaxID=2026947 RepID=A0A835W8C3_9CHLO|nr:hypothetical protein HYH02_010122 [Chlamydomonas schloesseri]|eukprot:KAG2441283.1 hypothetical protein HYH02_010122 [Chlamydomonas schloesseri]
MLGDPTDAHLRKAPESPPIPHRPQPQPQPQPRQGQAHAQLAADAAAVAAAAADMAAPAAEHGGGHSEAAEPASDTGQQQGSATSETSQPPGQQPPFHQAGALEAAPQEHQASAQQPPPPPPQWRHPPAYSPYPHTYQPPAYSYAQPPQQPYPYLYPLTPPLQPQPQPQPQRSRRSNQAEHPRARRQRNVAWRMLMDLQAVGKALVRSALAADKGGDLVAAAEASVVFIELIDAAQTDPARAQQVLHFLLDICTSSPASAELRSLLGAVCLEVVPRLLALAAASPQAAATAGQLVEGVLAAAGCCSPRELVMALMELYDSHKESAFGPGSGSLHLLLLGLLRGPLPALIVAVQRRRLKVAFSVLQAVVDLAKGAGRQLLRLTDLTAAASAAAAASAGDDSGEGGGGGTMAREGVTAGVSGSVAAVVQEQAEEAAAALVEPFADFAEQLHIRVLTAELPPRMPADAAAATTPASSGPPATAAAGAGGGDRSDRAKLGSWLLALLGALWPAWSAARSAEGPGLGTAVEVAVARLAALLPPYLPPAIRPTMAKAVPADGGFIGDDGCEARRCDSGALGVSWEGLWAAAAAGAPLPRQAFGEAEDGDGDEDGYGGADEPEDWTLSDPQQARLGAAVVAWLDVCGGCSNSGSGGRSSSGISGGSTGTAAVMAAAACAASCAARLPAGFLPYAPPADGEVAVMYLLRFIEAHMDASLGGNSSSDDGSSGGGADGDGGGHTEPLNRALAMINAAALRLRLQRQQWHLPVAAPGHASATGGSCVASESADAVRSSWAALAECLGCGSGATEDGWASVSAALQGSRGGASAASSSCSSGHVDTPAAAAALPTLGTEAQRALLPLAWRAAQRLLLCMDCAGSEALRRQCHDAWQALLALLPPAVRAAVLCRQATALGATPTVRSIVLQRLQREVAAAAAAASAAAAMAAHVQPSAASAPAAGAAGAGAGLGPGSRPGAQQALPGGSMVAASGATAMVAAFAGPWVLRPVLHQLQALQRQAGAAAGLSAGGTAHAGPEAPSAAALDASAAVGAEGMAVGAVLDNADAAVAALSVLRFMALRFAAGGSAASTEASTIDPRLSVLWAVQRQAVAPLRPLVARALEEMKREVTEAEAATMSAAAAAAAGDTMAAQLSAAVTAAAAAAGDRFAGNVAVLSGTLSGLTGVSRVAELLDYLQELLGS